MTVVALAMAGGIALAQRAGAPAATPATPAQPLATGSSSQERAPPATLRTPRLVDLGAEDCPPCQRMKPHLAQLTVEQRGYLDVEVHDVWAYPAIGDLYGVRSVPTQIFFDRDGREFARHQGFLSKQEIVARFRAHGLPLNPHQ